MKRLMYSSYLGLLYIFLYIPIIVVIFFSFNNAQHSLLWHGYTTRWYHLLFQDSNLAIIALHSFEISTLSASLATLLGMLASLSLFRYRVFGHQILYGLLFSLIIIPDIIIGLSLLLLFRLLHVPFGFWTLLLSHITFCIPFTFIIIHTRLTQLDKNILNTARDLRASEYIIFTRILIPLMAPALMAGWLLSFTLSLDDVMISFFVSGPNYQVLPLKIYAMVRVGVSPEINALCTLLLILTLLIVIPSQLILRRKPS